MTLTRIQISGFGRQIKSHTFISSLAVAFSYKSRDCAAFKFWIAMVNMIGDS